MLDMNLCVKQHSSTEYYKTLILLVHVTCTLSVQRCLFNICYNIILSLCYVLGNQSGEISLIFYVIIAFIGLLIATVLAVALLYHCVILKKSIKKNEDSEEWVLGNLLCVHAGNYFCRQHLSFYWLDICVLFIDWGHLQLKCKCCKQESTCNLVIGAMFSS